MAPSARRWLALLGLALVGVFFWHSPWLAPVRLMVVVTHESGHALMALATGGSVEGVTVSLNEGGRALTRGGSYFLTLNGGYLGSLFFGILLLASARRPGRGRVVVGLFGVFLVGAALLWFRPVVSFGFVYTLCAGALMVALGAIAPPWLADGLVRFLGVFSAMYALVDITDDVFRDGLLGGSWYGGGATVTDAHLLADLTGVPAPIWGIGWIIAGGAALWASRRLIA